MVAIVSQRWHTADIVESNNVEGDTCSFSNFLSESTNIHEPYAIGYAKLDHRYALVSVDPSIICRCKKAKGMLLADAEIEEYLSAK